MIWIGFTVFVLTMLALALGVFDRKTYPVGMKRALAWSDVWIALASVMALFAYLRYGLAADLVFVGAKMLLVGFYTIPTLTSLLVIVGVLAISVIMSLLRPKRVAVKADTVPTVPPAKPRRYCE